MSTFKYLGEDPIEIPAFGVRLVKDATFEVPDAFDSRFENDVEFEGSRRKRPDIVVDPAVTGPVPVQAAPDEFTAA